MMLTEEELTLEEIDEVLHNVSVSLQDKYGNRLTWQRKEFYNNLIDNLLDKRLILTNKIK